MNSRKKKDEKLQEKLDEIEQGKTNLNLDKVNLVLKMFGHVLAPVKSKELSE